MSTYLERLVNRLVQPEAEIQPRLPGLFEPSPLRSQAASVEAAMDVSATRSEGTPEEAEKTQFAIEAVISEEPAQNRATSPTQPAPTEQAQPQRSQPLQPIMPGAAREFAAPQPPQRSLGEAQAAPAGRVAFHPLPAAPPLESDGREAQEGAEIGEIHTVSRALIDERKARPGSLLPHPADLKPVQLPGDNPAEHPQAPSRPILTRLAAPGANPAEPAAAPAQPNQAGPGAAPQIHITIGRIEIRAANPPPAAPRKAATRQGPAVSLEDYLKRRQGGSK